MKREPRKPVVGSDGSALVRYEFRFMPLPAGESESDRGGFSEALELPPEVAILWIATAAWSGIVGNAAYDLLKDQLKSMGRFFASRKELKRTAELAVLSLLSFQGQSSDLTFRGRAKIYRSKQKTRCVLLTFEIPLDHELWQAEIIQAVVEFGKLPHEIDDGREVRVWLKKRGILLKE